MNLSRYLYGILVTNIVVWVIWAMGDRSGGGLPWPAWVTIGSVLFALPLLVRGNKAAPGGGGRERNRDRNRDRDRNRGDQD